MKKIKAFANNAFVRPDRTEVLTENLQEAERRIDQIKATCETLAKRVHECLQGRKGKENAVIEKRIKKVPEYQLGSSMLGSSESLGEGSLLGYVLGESGQIEMKLGQAIVEHEVKIEEQILKPLQVLLENDIPNVYKLRRHLAKCTETMDSAKAKYLSANRHSMNVGQGSGGGGAKADNIKEEYEESLTKVEQARDNLAAEMYSLLARESEISKLVVDLLTFQKEYHHQIYSILQELMSNVEGCLTHSVQKPVYGHDLEEHLKSSSRTIAYPIELCICGLLETGLEEEGLFRIAGSTSKVKKLKSAFDAGLMNLPSLLQEFCDPHVIANALKCYFREMPEPLLTFELYGEWLNAIRIQDGTQKLEALWLVVKKLPQSHYDNLRYLVKFLKELSDHESSNKMSPANIAIVIGPNLLWAKPNTEAGDICGESQMGFNMAMTHQYSAVLDQLVSNCSYFFPEDIDFFVTCIKPENKLVNGISSTARPEESDDKDKMKRSHSNSSVDNEENQSPTHGSPKPIIRRKNKPAPTPPTQPPQSKVGGLHKNPLANISKPFSGNYSPATNPKVNSNSSTPATLNSNRPITSGSDGGVQPKNRRDGVMLIPPSPKEATKRSENGSIPSTTSSQPPSKPPPPSGGFNSNNNDKNAGLSPSEMAKMKFMETGNANVTGTNGPPPKPESPLKYKSSFKSNSTEKEGNVVMSSSTTDNINHSSPSVTSATSNFASLPRHFHTENSYKNKPARPPSMFGVGNQRVSGPPPPPPSTATVKDKEVVEPPQKLQTTTGTSDISQGSTSGLNIGFERIEADVRKESISSSEDEIGKIFSKKDEDRKDQEDPRSNLTPTPPFPKPVPAPRASLGQSHSFKEVTGTGGDNSGVSGVPAPRERPTILAKPRDLGGRRNLSSHSFNHSQSSAASTPQENPSEDIVQNTGLRSSQELIKGSCSSSQSSGDEGNNNNNNAPNHGFGSTCTTSDSLPSPTSSGLNGKTIPHRPPRPHPPAPPPPKASHESTDL